jgi:hypothetical protein
MSISDEPTEPKIVRPFRGLNYLWLRAMMHNTHQRLHGARVMCGYKPLLHYSYQT